MLHSISTKAFIMSAVTILLTGISLPASAQNAAITNCKKWFDSVSNIQELATSQEALLAMRRCIELGMDPPLKIRPNLGRAPAASVPRSQIPGTTCPPFATCLYTARLSHASSTGQALNPGGGGGPIINDPTTPTTIHSAPQFTGHLPSEVPTHLESGGTIYFYGTQSLLTPYMSLIYPDASQNYYADGTAVTLTNGHVMTPPAPEGDIMAQQAIRMNQDGKFNFDDGGIMVLPTGFSGVIDGKEVKGGDIIIIDHAGETYAPAGTRLYPYPMGSHSHGRHKDVPGHEPYSGSPVKLPSNAALELNEDDKDIPGSEKWW